MTLNEISDRLRKAGIDDAKNEAFLLIEHFTGVDRTHILLDYSRDFVSAELGKAVAEREKRRPLQYIFGTWSFMGLEFEVNENVLVPRPDTEIIAETAISMMPKGGKLLDLFTGSGCIAAAVLNYTDCTADAVELYPETAEAARRNLDKLGFSDRSSVIAGDAADEKTVTESYDIITANPPYVTLDEMKTLSPETLAEPEHALTDGGNGLSFYEAIFRIYPARLKKGGAIIAEHGAEQGRAVRAIAESYGLTVKPLKDYGGHERGIAAKLK